MDAVNDKDEHATWSTRYVWPYPEQAASLSRTPIVFCAELSLCHNLKKASALTSEQFLGWRHPVAKISMTQKIRRTR